MTISRTALADYLSEQFSAIAVSIDQDDDPVIGYKPDIDNALRVLGKGESQLATATVEDSSRNAYFALGEYFAARRLRRQLGDRVNTRTGLNTYDFTNQLRTVKEIMEEAKAVVTALGFDVTGTGWTMGHMNLDWLENEPVSA